MSEPGKQEAKAANVVGLERIKQLIPHRYPMLLVDRVLDWSAEPVRRITAIKNVTVNEPFFPGHFPDNPVMPGVLIIEAMAQAAGILGGLLFEGDAGDPLYYLVKIDKAKFTKPVIPGDQLVMEVVEKRRLRNVGIFECQGFVDGKRVAQSEIMCAGRS
jgi:3-hydroxyacyl-[acyl-carrier-protein] dehydratase